MKKHLLTSTALVAAGLVAFGGTAIAKPKLTVNGNTSVIFGVGENDAAFDAATQTSSINDWDVQQDAEIHFNASTKLDNGIKIKARIELEGNTDGDQIDEHWMRISGSFGEIRVGSTDMVAKTMTAGYQGSSAGVGLSLPFDTSRFVSNPGGVTTGNANFADLTSDSEGVAWYSPRMSGFQLGVGYVPARSQDSNGGREATTVDSHGRSLGVNYVTKMDGTSIAIAASYETYAESTVNQDDPEVMAIAAKVGFSGVNIQASFVERAEVSTISTGATAVAGLETFEIGANYKMGANKFSVALAESETVTDAGAAGDGDDQSILAVAWSRAVAPGVNFSLTAWSADYNDGAVGATSATSNSGEAIAGRLKVSF
ncbi:MAG: hypothetical protein CFH41_01154 [Alphaproteobacteria bacterium MarineAlpha11_Bin1]|nr:MAG: hypothetical protein CFH41_01154 [Alphaproteobacteria bacterium MarineAlpha11_Bin1]|tara:strand:+ start:20036 stop:21148 length:1113 start_codon:yes stop_codon:yes gene_type:complete